MTDANVFAYKKKYSHRIVGIYRLTEPNEIDKKRGSWATMDAEQYFESSATGQATSFRFLRELLLYINGKRMYSSYYESLGLIAKRLNEHFESYLRRNSLILDVQALEKEPMKGSLECRIMIGLLRDDETKVDADVTFFIDGESAPVTDMDTVFRAKGLAVCSTFIKELLFPLSQAQVNPDDQTGFPKRKAIDENREN